MPVVVIVDDRALNLRILRSCAEQLGEGVVVRTYCRAADALDSLPADRPDLIVTDYVMPGMSGEELIYRCRASPVGADIPIVVVTAFEDKECRYRAFDAGASDFLLSPVDPREFCIRARHLLTLRAQQQTLRNRASSLETQLAAALRRHAEELQQRERNLRRIVNTVPALIRAADETAVITLLNEYHEQVFGLAVNDVAGKTLNEVFDPDYGDRHEALNRAVLAQDRTLTDVEETITDIQGRKRVFLTTKAPLNAEDGNSPQVVTVSIDITDRKHGEQALRESEQRFRALVEGSLLGIVIKRDGKPLFANQQYASIFGYDSPAEILALPTLDVLYAPGERDRVRRYRANRNAGKTAPIRYEVQGLRRDGTLIWNEAQVQRVSWQGETAYQFTVADITLRKEYEFQLERQANFDALTGLPNRVLVLDRLRGAILSATRHDHKVGVLFLDLDNFKKINDTLGHATGDMLLKMAADRLTGCVRAEDTVARLGGDEFTVILPKLSSADQAEPVIQKIIDAFATPFVLGADEAFVTVSIGVTVAPDDGSHAHLLMQNADAAMYRAKEQGRNTFQYFTTDLNRRAVERMRLESHLLRALERDELCLHYQPIYDLRTMEVVGAEALLRWVNPVLGSVEPERFIPLAEDTGLIVSIGAWVLDTACRQIADWKRRGFPAPRVAVNISSRQFRGRDLLNTLSETLHRHGIDNQAIELEITEGLLMDELPQTKNNLRELAAQGVRLSLDDFGTGYSSLKYLSQYPVTTLKIDKTFVADVPADAGDASVVEAIIAMACRLGVEVVGEGIETEDQLQFLKAHGCHMGQGFLFSRPLPAEEFERAVSTHNGTAAAGGGRLQSLPAVPMKARGR
ncbi:MAG: EAL domain-containing protein [Rhodospirillales bacterium]|nr:EAL domain-containing protein [Rhodospirillales bacterium]